MATQIGWDQETLASLVEEHGYIVTAPYGRLQNRRLCSDLAFRAGVGHNADPSSIRGKCRDGLAKAAPFPVFYPEHLASIVWTLDRPGIVKAVSEHGGSKRGRIQVALEDQAYSPNNALADLCDCSTKEIEKARLRTKATQ